MRTWAQVVNSGSKGQKRRSPFLLITLTLLFALAASCVVVARLGSHDVTVCAWDRAVKLTTSARTVQDVLTEANVILGPKDHCNPAPETALTQGMNISVVRASLAFVVNGGKVQAVETAKETVREVLSQAGIEVGADDAVIPNLDDALPEDGRIKVVRVAYGEIVEEEKIPYTIERRNDSSLEAGLVRTYRNGYEGVSKVTYKVRYEDGVEASREEITRERVEEPTSQVLLVGTLRSVSRGGSDIRFSRAIEVLATAYCPCTICCGPNATGMTSSGIPAGHGVIAVDPRVIPMGSKVYVDGYGYATAADTGSAIKGSRIDVCFDTHQEALAWGMKRVKVYVIN